MQSPDAIARAYMNGAGCSQLGCSGLAEALETMANGLPLNNKAVVDVCSSPDVISTFRAFLGIIGEEADAVVQVQGNDEVTVERRRSILSAVEALRDMEADMTRARKRKQGGQGARLRRSAVRAGHVFDQLSDDLLVYVMSYVSVADLCIMEGVNKRGRSVAQQASKIHLHPVYPRPMLPTPAERAHRYIMLVELDRGCCTGCQGRLRLKLRKGRQRLTQAMLEGKAPPLCLHCAIRRGVPAGVQDYMEEAVLSALTPAAYPNGMTLQKFSQVCVWRDPDVCGATGGLTTKELMGKAAVGGRTIKAFLKIFLRSEDTMFRFNEDESSIMLKG